MSTFRLAVLAASIAIAGWTNPAVADLFSAKGPVIAILADDLFLGEAEGHLNGSGTLAMQSQKNAAVSCLGQFTSSAALGGSGQMQCTDGATGTFHFQRLSLRSGHGGGSSTRGSLSFTYGLTALESVSYLKLPAARKLVHSGNKLELVDISSPLPKPAVALVPQPVPILPANSTAVVLTIAGSQESVPAHPAVVVAQAAAPSAQSAAPAARAPGQDVAPDELLNTVTSAVIGLIKQDRDIQDGNSAKVFRLVETRILPHFAFARMTQSAMGRNWGLATAEQQKALTLEFRTLLVRTYSSTLLGYRDQVIEYKPLRSAPEATEVTVRSEVKQPGRERVTIDYDMEKTPAGWKVYDIKISGVSLVAIYRDTFAGRVRDGGIEGLIKSLSDKNRQSGLNTASSER